MTPRESPHRDGTQQRTRCQDQEYVPPTDAIRHDRYELNADNSEQGQLRPTDHPLQDSSAVDMRVRGETSSPEDLIDGRLPRRFPPAAVRHCGPATPAMAIFRRCPGRWDRRTPDAAIRIDHPCRVDHFTDRNHVHHPCRRDVPQHRKPAYSPVGHHRVYDALITQADLADPRALARAQRKAHGLTGIRFEHAYAQRLPYANGDFDRVLSSMMLHHLGDDVKARAAAEVFRVLRPGGSLHLVDIGGDITAHDGLAARLMIHNRHAADNLGDSIPRLLRAAGFDCTEVATHAQPRRWGSDVSVPTCARY
jgi:hypothetical protein